jgi:serine/threonine protein kinase
MSVADEAAAVLDEGLKLLRPRIRVDYSSALGGGAFGIVYEACWQDGWRHDADHSPLAVKVVSERGLSQKAKAQLRREVALHARIKHAHILSCHGAYSKSGSLHLVLERAAGDIGSAIQGSGGAAAAGDIGSVIQGSGGAAAAISLLAPVLTAQLLCALRRLHELEIVHSDIKPSNLLLTFSGRLQVCDLGAASRLAAGGGRTTMVGTPAYTAPEVVAIAHLGLDISGATYGFAADLWSAGVVLVEMLTCGALPFPAEPRDAADQQARICFRPPRLEPASAFSPSARSLTLQLLAKQPHLRPTAAEALTESRLLALYSSIDGDGGGDRDGMESILSADEQAAIRACLSFFASGDGGAAGLERRDLCVSFGEATAIIASPPSPPHGHAPAPPPPPEVPEAELASESSLSARTSSPATDASPTSSIASWASSLVEGSPC